MSKVIPRARITKPSSTTASQSSPTSQNTTPAVSSPPIAKEETTTITGVNSSSSQPSNVVTPSSSTNTSTTPEKRGNPSTTSRIKTSTNPPSQLQQQKEPVHSKTSSLDDDLQFLYSSAGFSLSKEQQAKFNRYSKRMVLKRKLEQFRLIAFVKQIFNNYVNPITLCIIYHRQNFGEYVMALFDDRDKLTDLYPLTNDKASVTICPNPITFTDLCLQINCNNDEEESKTFYFQCESEMQLLSIMSAFQKALLYNGQDAKYNKPSFHSLVSTYSQKKPKNGQQKTPIPFSWCDQYLARYSSNEDLDLKKTKNPLLNKLLGDDSSNDSTCLSSSPYGSLKYVSSSRGRFDEQDNHGGLASRHKTSYMSDHDDDDENNEEQIDSQHVDTYFQKTILPKTTTTHIVETRTSPQRNHEVTSVAHHDEPPPRHHQ
ncbi:hypothetical protein C9374_006109 [Naegleria lovaniensis]|uniref:Uncharacterized protein n=1 Tax=Naegleria lovaniensis TaxID=51637 RepID=A0AA88KJN4_NAELO|nr:uncharacterized protein C9374_006109 [Naegleria lovaniensis]KAG2381725.1 hypothetical protein C9374_006109 [Naegleria lovaniensis]